MLSPRTKIRDHIRDEQSGPVAWSLLDLSLFPAVSHSSPSAVVSGAVRASKAGRMSPMSRESSELKALCVGRHRYLSDHFKRFFRKLGVDASSVVGIVEAIPAAHAQVPDVVFCEYDLLATVPLEPWERDPLLSRIPVIAVSLTRRSDEMHLLDVNNIAGFFYLPSLTDDDARRLLRAVRPSAGYSLRSVLDRPMSSSTPPA